MTRLVAQDVSREQAYDLHHAATLNSHPYSNWVKYESESLFRRLDWGDSGELKLEEPERSRAISIVEDKIAHENDQLHPNRVDAWEDLLDKLENAQVPP
ncbi:hypothetical protein HUG10_21230 (plasmid) [Halorarum halophilum]|uniref:Uncharacterized protein n=1 Tax=Halorarum halophilum TaxID=2743090 RepID=A0A7D5GEX1_9EURY|nr:hypothetical protein [Halobaculum halophilum]QLG30112.1 hypothetical protein HUG10_21230 [Halobaculum halophilum]